MATTTTNVEKAPRITKSMKFDALAAALQGQDLPHSLTTQDLLAFIEAEKAALAKKNSKERKPTKEQEANEGYKKLIVEYLSTLGDDDTARTCTDMIKSIPAFNGFSTSKASSLATQLKNAGVIEARKVKGRTMFYIA